METILQYIPLKGEMIEVGTNEDGSPIFSMTLTPTQLTNEQSTQTNNILAYDITISTFQNNQVETINHQRFLLSKPLPSKPNCSDLKDIEESFQEFEALVEEKIKDFNVGLIIDGHFEFDLLYVMQTKSSPLLFPANEF